MEHLSSVKEALHVSTSPSTVVCRENEQNKVLEFCKKCIEQESSGSLYVCGCPGTGKSLLMEKVKEALVDWAKEVRFTNCILGSLIRSYYQTHTHTLLFYLLALYMSTADLFSCAFMAVWSLDLYFFGTNLASKGLVTLQEKFRLVKNDITAIPNQFSQMLLCPWMSYYDRIWNETHMTMLAV